MAENRSASSVPDRAADTANQPAHPPIAIAVVTGICALFGVLGYVARKADLPPWLTIVCLTVAYLAGGGGPTINAISALRRMQLNVDLLMILAAVGAAIIGDSLEGVVLLFLFSLSGTLEAFAIYRTHRSLEALIRLRPQEALLISDVAEDDRRVPVETLVIGQRVRVRPGERFPVDGLVVDGETWADESTLTGESDSIHKVVGATVFAGTLNGSGVVVVEMTRAVADTTIERIVHMVREAQAQKTPTQQFVESWQQPYVIGVLLAAVCVFVGARIFHAQSWEDAFYHSMVLLVAASPCAVVVGSPAVMLSAIARAGRHGVLFKGAVSVESLAKVDVLAMDKTGTATLGKPAITEIWASDPSKLSRLLSLAAAVEQRSEHPLAAPLVDDVKRRGIPIAKGVVTDFHSHVGLGVHGRIDGVWVGVGREGLFTSHDMQVPPAMIAEAVRLREAGQTALLILVEGEPDGAIVAMADQPRPEAAETLVSLKRLGIRKVVILTGDHERVARNIAARIGADDVRAGLLPDQKVMELRRLSAEGQWVAMVGDGVNDAPALAAARLGVAMGGAGTDVALEVADVVLMGDDLRGLPVAVWISRVARHRVRQNMMIAFGMIAALVLSSFANLPLWLGVLGHEGSTVIVVFNGLRILWQRIPASV